MVAVTLYGSPKGLQPGGTGAPPRPTRGALVGGGGRAVEGLAAKTEVPPGHGTGKGLAAPAYCVKVLEAAPLGGVPGGLGTGLLGTPKATLRAKGCWGVEVRVVAAVTAADG